MLKSLLTLALMTTLAIPTHAQESNIKQTLEAKLGVPVTSVTKSGYLGLYEVFLNGQIIYTDEKATAFLAGNLVDTKTMTSVTESRLQTLNAVKFSELPLNQAIKQVKGNGKRTLVTFEDPNCGYCKRLAKDIEKLDNVTLYVFLYPILSEDSIRKSRQIWCSADKVKTWNDWMVNGKAPTGKDDCDTSAIINNVEYGQKLRITGTPTLIFVNGERIPGAVPLAKIEEKLNSAK